MIRIRFASGLVIQYNNANCCTHDAGFHTPFNKQGEKKEWVATIPLDAIVEAVYPCSVKIEPVPKEMADLAFELRTLKQTVSRLLRKAKA